MAVGDLFIDREEDVWEEVSIDQVACRRDTGEWKSDGERVWRSYVSDVWGPLVRLVPVEDDKDEVPTYVTRDELADILAELMGAVFRLDPKLHHRTEDVVNRLRGAR